MKKQTIVLALAALLLCFNSCREVNEKEVETTIEEITPEVNQEIQEVETDSLSIPEEGEDIYLDPDTTDEDDSLEE